MSLIRIAARIAAVEALKGATLVGNNVLNSKIGALDVTADGALRTDQEKPFIAVYTDAATTKDGEDIANRASVVNGLTEITFEAGIAATMTITDQETGIKEVVAGIPATDDAFETYLDIVCRQIGDALTDPENEWAEILRRLSMGNAAIERARTASQDKVRLAGHQIKYVCKLIADPVRGKPLGEQHVLTTFFAKVAAGDNESYKAQAALMQAQIGSPDFEWKIDQRRYGMSVGELRALLLSMQPGAEADIELVEINASPAEPISPL